MTNDEITIEKMHWKQSLLALIIPLFVQLICLIPVALIDPCRNNIDCGDGSVVNLTALMLIPASAVFLFFIVIAETYEGVAFRKALKINNWLAFVPFIIGYIWFFIH